VRVTRFRFSVAVLLPVVCAVAVTVALAAGFIFWSAERTDAQALGREQRLVAHLVAGAQSDFEGEQGTVILRYEAAEAFLGDEPDMEWIDAELGYGEFFDFDHEQVYVLDPDLEPIYAARNGEEVKTGTYNDVRAFVDPIAVRFRAPDLAAEIKAYEDGESDWPPQISDLIRLGGRPAFVSVMPIVSNWEGQEQEAGEYYYHVAVQLLGSNIAEMMMEDYLLEAAHFDVTPNTLPHETMVPMQNNAGRFVAYFKWVPQRPGAALLDETLPASLALLGVIGVVIALLLFGLARSTRALEKARAEALHRATHDPLTGLANRALFKERLDHSPLPLGLLALDLDRFKQVNDELGHEAGDELLKQVWVRLASLVREDDLVARLGGDEFMVLIQGPHDSTDLAGLAARIVTAIAEPFHLPQGTARIGVSVGIATALNDERTELVSRADFALYDAKENGRNTWRVFEELKQAA
jgi:diguanylate cyclase (GGDEF)-like protein